MSIAKDKQLHFVTGAALAAAILLLGFEWWVALAVTASVGVLKELAHDLAPKRGTLEVMDAVFTAAGGGFACLMAAVLGLP